MSFQLGRVSKRHVTNAGPEVAKRSAVSTPAARASNVVRWAGTQRGSRVTVVDRYIAGHLQRAIEGVRVRLELWDCTSPYSASAPPVGDLIVVDRRTLLGLLMNPDLCFGEAYAARRLEIRGSLSAVIEALYRASTPAPSWIACLRAALAVPNTLASARRHVHHHYDLGNDFYR